MGCGLRCNSDSLLLKMSNCPGGAVCRPLAACVAVLGPRPGLSRGPAALRVLPNPFSHCRGRTPFPAGGGGVPQGAAALLLQGRCVRGDIGASGRRNPRPRERLSTSSVLPSRDKLGRVPPGSLPTPLLTSPGSALSQHFLLGDTHREVSSRIYGCHSGTVISPMRLSAPRGRTHMGDTT